MIIWINGAFGCGKSTISYELNRRLPGSYIFDPENFGFFLRRNLPALLQFDDFQDEPLWRDINLRLLQKLNREFSGCIIVPMTITNPHYFDELIGGLRSLNIRVDHYLLEASRYTLEKRLKSRLDGKKSWPMTQIDRCLAAFESDIFDTKINTDHRSIRQITESIALLSALELKPDREPAFLKRLVHTFHSLKRIRWS